MTKRESQKKTRAIKVLLASFDAATRHQILWNLLTTSLSGDVTAVNWLLDEVGKFVESEGDKLMGKFKG